MGAYDGAEVCELIGIFMLSLLSNQINKNHIGLYRYDGLAILKNTSGPAAENLKKKIQKLFTEKDLDIIVQCNLKITNYLDMTRNLNNGSYSPYRKPTKKPTIFPLIQTTLHQSLKKFHGQLKKDSQFCHHQKIFFRSQPFTMRNAQKTVDIKPSYNINNQMKTIKTKRKENVTLFGSIHHTASQLKPISEEYPPNHKFVKIFNKNTIKLSYSCMPNIRSKINCHNKKYYNPSPQSHKNYATALLKTIAQ